MENELLMGCPSQVEVMEMLALIERRGRTSWWPVRELGAVLGRGGAEERATLVRPATEFVDIYDALLSNDDLTCLTRDDGFLPDDVSQHSLRPLFTH